MLLVKTKIGPSKIEGIGLFAAEFIPKGTPLWKFMPGFDVVKEKKDLASLSEASREQFLKYSSNFGGKYVLGFDDSRFWNHSEQPNVKQDFSSDPFGIEIAARDIEEGEELTEDYKLYDDDFDRKMQIR